MFLRGGGTESACRLILVTGGARAGKSRFAQSLSEQGAYRRRIFVATAVPCDQEMRRRIDRHRRTRNGLWTTLEESIRLPERIPPRFLQPGHLILLDCLPTFLTNLLLEGYPAQKIRLRIARLIKALRQPGLTGMVVTNEVGLGIVPENALGRQFRDLLGAVNQQMAKAAEEVYLLLSGIPVRVK